MDRVIYQLNKDELEEIEELNEKKVAFENLLKCIDPDNERLYEKLMKDYTKTIKEFNKWWENMKHKYSWDGNNWAVDFATGNIRVIS
ncbi:MAG: CXXX repeat peptide modification system protein [Clostridium sp.]|uniref:CXXX repeat peptide modification system protein n=1 Tax=Clostridium sp. TaxID=1506 RepID=UPI00242F7007|nr:MULTISPECIES: CXXX repeat peptide modification system protein [Clostridium]MDU5211597.1 CXXX repeat peptide modification system protein [Clostridium sp.]MDU6763324.1 CXXX repeat peptide modification system protein [Clostridium sp.]